MAAPSSSSAASSSSGGNTFAPASPYLTSRRLLVSSMQSPKNNLLYRQVMNQNGEMMTGMMEMIWRLFIWAVWTFPGFDQPPSVRRLSLDVHSPVLPYDDVGESADGATPSSLSASAARVLHLEQQKIHRENRSSRSSPSGEQVCPSTKMR